MGKFVKLKRKEYMDKNERKDRILEQVRLLREFYKNLQTWEVESVGAWIAAGILLSCGTVFFWIPCQEYGGDSLDQMMYIMMFFLICMGLVLYLRPYLLIYENGTQRRQKNIMEKLQYLPVDHRSILYFQLGKLFKMAVILDAVQLAGQCVAVLIAFGHLEPRNFLFPIVFGMLLPAGVNVLSILGSIYTKRT